MILVSLSVSHRQTENSFKGVQIFQKKIIANFVYLGTFFTAFEIIVCAHLFFNDILDVDVMQKVSDLLSKKLSIDFAL